MRTPTSRIVDPAFWLLSLEERMAAFAEWRAESPIHAIETSNLITGETETFYALLGYEEVLEVSRRPEDFCSGRGATSIFDLPQELLEYFGGFINMDGARHDRQRTIVSRSFL